MNFVFSVPCGGCSFTHVVRVHVELTHVSRAPVATVDCLTESLSTIGLLLLLSKCWRPLGGPSAKLVCLGRWGGSAGVLLPFSLFLSSCSLLFPIFLSGVGVRFSGFGFGVLPSLFFLRPLRLLLSLQLQPTTLPLTCRHNRRRM
jgi:hypothetical protein